MATLLKRLGGIVGAAAVIVGAAWLLPVSPAEQPGGVFSAVFEAKQPATASRPATNESAPSSDSVLLLRNGEMITGQITRSGDRYRVRVAGGEVNVKAADVQYECRDMEEAYQKKRTLIRRDYVMDHLDLTQWCIKAGLLDQAARELAEATALDAKHPLIPVLERRVKVAASPPPPVDPNVRRAPVGPTPQELDRMVRGMPPKTVEMFSQAIQPMLVNNCSAAACHGHSVPNGFRLFRTSPDSPPSRLVTQRNLHAVLEWLDHDNPEVSPLLRYATQAHGTARVAIFTDRQMLQFRQLRDWCCRVAQAESPVIHASYDEPIGASPSYGTNRGSVGGRNARRQRTDSAGGSIPRTPPLSTWDSGMVDLRSRPSSQGQNRAQHRGDATQMPATSDPFDPESFNQRFSPGGRPQNGSKPSQASQPRDVQAPAAETGEPSRSEPARPLPASPDG